MIIISWNTKQLLSDCLASLQREIGSLRVETIVVDNASRDGSAAMVARDYPEARLLVNARNEGFAAANNRGLGLAHGRYLLLLNSDTVVLPGAIGEMVRYMDAHPAAGALGPRLLNADRTLQSTARDFPRLDHDLLAVIEAYRWPWLGEWLERRQRNRSLYFWDHSQTREVDWVMGACLMLRRTALEQAGVLDSRFFFFGEEMELCYRLRQHGWPTIYLAGTELIHLGGQSSAQVPVARLLWHYSGVLRFYALHRPRRERRLLSAGIALAAAVHIASLLLRHRHSPEARPLLSAYGRVLTRALTAAVR